MWMPTSPTPSRRRRRQYGGGSAGIRRRASGDRSSWRGSRQPPSWQADCSGPRAVPRRLHLVPDRRLVYRDLPVAPADLQRMCGVLVTTPERTLADLARLGDETHSRAAQLLAASAPGLVAAAIARLESGSLPHKRAALNLLRQIAATAQEDVTRYTS